MQLKRSIYFFYEICKRSCDVNNVSGADVGTMSESRIDTNRSRGGVSNPPTPDTSARLRREKNKN